MNPTTATTATTTTQMISQQNLFKPILGDAGYVFVYLSKHAAHAVARLKTNGKAIADSFMSLLRSLLERVLALMIGGDGNDNIRDSFPFRTRTHVLAPPSRIRGQGAGERGTITAVLDSRFTPEHTL